MKNRRKFKVPDTISKLLVKSDLRGLADFLADPKNNIKQAIIIVRNNEGSVQTEATEGLFETEIYGLLEHAKLLYRDIFNGMDE